MDALTPAPGSGCLTGLAGIPVSFVAPSVHSASNHPLPSRCVIWRFLPSGLPSDTSLSMCRVLADLASWVSPFPSRLTTATGRIEFAVTDARRSILRTGRSPPVALHPASRRRSYLRLRGARTPSTRTCTSPMQQHYRRTRTGFLARPILPGTGWEVRPTLPGTGWETRPMNRKKAVTMHEGSFAREPMGQVTRKGHCQASVCPERDVVHVLTSATAL